MPDYVENGALVDLTDDVDFSLFDEDTMALSEVDGRYYSVPWLTLDTRTVYYNKDMFEEHGWEVPKTFSEFEDLLAEIKGEGITPISMALESWSLLFGFEPLLADMIRSTARNSRIIQTSLQQISRCVTACSSWLTGRMRDTSETTGRA